MKKLCLILCVMSFSVAIGMLSTSVLAEVSDCSLENVKVEISEQIDAEIACEGIRRALSFFESYGYTGFKHIHVKMFDQVAAEPQLELDDRKDVKHYFAMFSAITRCSEIITWGKAYEEQRKIFGSIPDSPEYHSSIVAHEVAHDLYHQIFESMGKKVERPLTEFISYAVQIGTLKEKERNQVLALWPDSSFSTVSAINLYNWAAAPNRFGIKSYRYHIAHPEFVKSILQGEVKTYDWLMPYEFLYPHDSNRSFP